MLLAKTPYRQVASTLVRVSKGVVSRVTRWYSCTTRREVANSTAGDKLHVDTVHKVASSLRRSSDAGHLSCDQARSVQNSHLRDNRPAVGAYVSFHKYLVWPLQHFIALARIHVN